MNLLSTSNDIARFLPNECGCTLQQVEHNDSIVANDNAICIF